MSNSQSGSSSLENKELLTCSSTLSSSEPSDSKSAKLESVLATASTVSPGAALNYKQSNITQKMRLASRVPGSTASRPSKVKAPDLIFGTSLQALSKMAGQSESSQQSIQANSSEHTADGKPSDSSPMSSDGETSDASLYADRPAQENLRQFMKRTDTTKYTLSQAKILFGSMGMSTSVFSFLTNMRALSNQKNSISSWMDILTNFASNTDLLLLNSQLSSSSATSIGSKASRKRLFVDLTQEDSSSSSDAGATVSHEATDIDSSSSSSPDESVMDQSSMDSDANSSLEQIQYSDLPPGHPGYPVYSRKGWASRQEYLLTGKLQSDSESE